MISTRASDASPSSAKAACQPAGAWPTAWAGNGRGIRGSTASTATMVASAPISGPRLVRAASSRARSSANASKAATSPSARIANRPGSTWARTGMPRSQRHGSRAAG